MAAEFRAVVPPPAALTASNEARGPENPPTSAPRSPAAAAQVLLLRMQEVKDIFVANAALDNLCTALFGVEVVFIAVALASNGQLPLFCMLLVLADALVSRVKLVGAAAGTWLSCAVHRAGLVDVAPLSGPIQLKKWTEQSWQLFLHVAFAALEWRILAQEPWHADPATCWSPHPYEQARTGHRSDLTLLYLAQLAVWVYTCVVHRFFDERRKDYFVLYVHHLVTIMLVGELLHAWVRVERGGG